VESCRFIYALRHLLGWLAVLASVRAADLTGRVVAISDGDTLTVLTPDKKQVRVRLHGIDTPESKQAFGTRARQELSSLVFGKDVRVEVRDTDRYGRTVGRVFAGSIEVNLEMVRRGFAWWYRDFAKGDKGLQQAERQARDAGVGLWADKQPIPPWEFRRQEAEKRKAVPSGAR
jgi:endonuclease YncB( thermonuclease family)